MELYIPPFYSSSVLSFLLLADTNNGISIAVIVAVPVAVAVLIGVVLLLSI